MATDQSSPAAVRDQSQDGTESRPAGVRHGRGAAAGRLLPAPPTNMEKRGWVHRELALLVVLSLVSVLALTLSQIHFVRLSAWLWILVPFLIFTILYYLVSLRINLPIRDFDLHRHDAIVEGWAPATRPSVDILLPICNEPLDVLSNTWRHVRRLADNYPADVNVYVLDDGDSPAAARLAADFDFHYHVRENRGWYKKAGNLRHGYQISSGEFLVVFDADFAPRDDFLTETLPYMDAEPSLGIVQTPQFFRVDRRQTLMERGAGAVQELFYRVVQVSRDRYDAAICVGSCAVYRRAALDAIGGTALIEHSEDVHTGFDLAGAGWGLRYLPIPLATGLCPPDPDSFLTQQYRWCAGSMSLLSSRKFWSTPMRPMSRLCYTSGFLYYLHTAVFTFVAPLIPILLLVFLPGEVHLRNYLWILPSTMYNFVVFPLWHRGRYGPSALMARMLYGWAHVFAVWDSVRSQPMEWQTTGAVNRSPRKTKRIWRAMAVWGGATSAVWVGTAVYRMGEMNAANFVFLLATGLVYAGIISMAFFARRQHGRRVLVLPE